MTEPERTALAEQLLAVVFSLRPDDGAIGQAWVMSTITTVLARAILGSVGPTGDAAPLLAIATERVRTMVADAQSARLRARLAVRS